MCVALPTAARMEDDLQAKWLAREWFFINSAEVHLSEAVCLKALLVLQCRRSRIGLFCCIRDQKSLRQPLPIPRLFGSLGAKSEEARNLRTSEFLLRSRHLFHIGLKQAETKGPAYLFASGQQQADYHAPEEHFLLEKCLPEFYSYPI